MDGLNAGGIVHIGDGRRNDSRCFAFEVERLLHGGRADVSQDRPVAEPARAELYSALEPADSFTRGQRLGRGVDQRGAQCAAGVARRGLNPDVVEPAVAQYLAVGHAVLMRHRRRDKDWECRECRV